MKSFLTYSVYSLCMLVCSSLSLAQSRQRDMPDIPFHRNQVQISNIRGEVWVQQDSLMAPHQTLTTTRIFSAGAIIQTGEHGSCTVFLDAQNAITVAQNTQLKILKSPAGRAKTKAIQLLRGRIAARVAPNANQDTFEVYGASALAKAKNAEFEIAQADDLCMLHRTVKGRITIQAKQDMRILEQLYEIESTDQQLQPETPSALPPRWGSWFAKHIQHLKEKSKQYAETLSKNLKNDTAELHKLKQELAAMQKQRDALLNSGLSENHPRMAALQANMLTVQQNIEACSTRIDASFAALVTFEQTPVFRELAQTTQQTVERDMRSAQVSYQEAERILTTDAALWVDISTDNNPSPVDAFSGDPRTWLARITANMNVLQSLMAAAQAQNDVILQSCIDESITIMSGLETMAQSAVSQSDLASSRGDAESAQMAERRAATAAQRSDVVLQQARRCRGVSVVQNRTSQPNQTVAVQENVATSSDGTALNPAEPPSQTASLPTAAAGTGAAAETSSAASANGNNPAPPPVAVPPESAPTNSSPTPPPNNGASDVPIQQGPFLE